MHEQEVLALLRAGDERGAEALLRHYAPLMRYIIAPIVPDAQDREECLSDAALRVWEKFGTYDPARGSWTAWLTALTRNTALNRARKKSGGSEELSGDLPSAEPTPEERLLQQERRQALERALTALPQRDRLLFYRKYYYLQSTAQIAAELGVTERAVASLLETRATSSLCGLSHTTPMSGPSTQGSPVISNISCVSQTFLLMASDWSLKHTSQAWRSQPEGNGSS